jgi:type III pantothenate kinase
MLKFMGKMYLVLDAGNTNVVAGLYSGSKLTAFWRFRTDAHRTEDEWFTLIHNVMHVRELDMDEISFCVLSSVVPQITRTLIHFFEKYVSCPFLVVNSQTELGLTFPVPDPSYVGADLIVNAYAVWRKYRSPAIVCDLGTATTLQLVGDDGSFHGTIIAPGLVTSLNQLADNAALLARIELESPKALLGTCTRDAMLSGSITGHALMIDGLVERIRTEYAHLGKIVSVITGGIAPLVYPATSRIDLLDRHLTLDGLALIAQKFTRE